MASEITYAEVKFKNESNSSGTYSVSATAPKVKPTPPLSKPGRPSLLFTLLMALFLLLAIAFLAAFIFYFQKYSQLLEEKKAISLTHKVITHKELNCKKDDPPTSDKVWSCCPKDWKPFNSHCYFISNDSSSWNKSEEKCSSMGAHLMVIHSQEEQDFITKILDRKAVYYIGLSDPGHRQWRWVDQTPYNESATFWHPGEPNYDHEQCVTVNHRNSGWGWNDIPCSVKQNAVCQVKKIYL
ncbi:C-type lectin domain family 4 member A-like [Peromyscus californicus insignis]|uniref:C-type lectin domain family 4 member A-like n=1 Tax=Peromyscus californicus insignis TaxID=564181 RepID=UPI0022A752D4|nr:C-type lectin domain family 4 member A-like [Peromyscus californicus insignis]